MPKLSIITINFNNLDGLLKTVKSVIKQSCQNFEYIIIDGGSTDGSKTYLETQEAYIKHLVSEPDKGIYDAMNKGIQKATGDYCLFLNSGDWLVDDKVISNISQIEDESDLLIFQMIKVYGPGKRKITNLKQLSLDRLTENSLPHQSTLIKTSLLRKLGGYDTDYKIVADWEFFIKAILIENCSYKVFDIPLSCFDMSGISNNPEHREHLMTERDKVKSKHLNEMIWQAGKSLHEQKKECHKKQTGGFNLLRKLKNLSR